jgi:hypothetical protein
MSSLEKRTGLSGSAGSFSRSGGWGFTGSNGGGCTIRLAASHNIAEGFAGYGEVLPASRIMFRRSRGRSSAALTLRWYANRTSHTRTCSVTEIESEASSASISAASVAGAFSAPSRGVGRSFSTASAMRSIGMRPYSRPRRPFSSARTILSLNGALSISLAASRRILSRLAEKNRGLSRASAAWTGSSRNRAITCSWKRLSSSRSPFTTCAREAR